MKKDKVKVYIIELLLICVVLFTLFSPNTIRIPVLAIVTLIFMIFVCFTFKKRKTNSIYKKQIAIIMTAFALIYIGMFYLLGLYFGYTKAKLLLSILSITKYIIPLTVIIISSEIIRKKLLHQEATIRIRSTKLNLSVMLVYVAMILIDSIVYVNIYSLTDSSDFLMILGFVLFASLSCNLLYNYISVRYDSKGIIIYKLITTLYLYIIPIIPDVYEFFRSFLRMIYPYIIYIIIEKQYSQRNFSITYNEKRKNIIGNLVLLVIMALSVMLISCQFRFGILVIGSGSMTGSINKGDAVIFEKYSNQEIKKGHVIIFDYNDVQTVHRVDAIRIVNGECRYYTKGDANSKRDEGYVTEDKIYGIVNIRIKYLGYPTLWVRKLFS